MNKANPDFNLEFYPPFEGFPKEGIEFLKKLKKNNRKDWFEKHKPEYETFVKLPMQSLIGALHPHFQIFAPEFEVNPKRSMFRIHRDIRFSKDKLPYKTHVAAHFVLRGKPKGVEGSGYYLHIEPGEVFLGGGIYMPDSDQLKRIRRALVEKSEEFLRIVNNRAFKRIFGTIKGEKLRRVPHGYDPEHPMREWLKLKQFFVGVSRAESSCRTGRFVDLVAKEFEVAMPLVRFLNQSMNTGTGTSNSR